MTSTYSNKLSSPVLTQESFKEALEMFEKQGKGQVLIPPKRIPAFLSPKLYKMGEDNGWIKEGKLTEKFNKDWDERCKTMTEEERSKFIAAIFS